ncbi:peptidase S8 [Alteriqipengyuania lutimaris]|uniref:Peptidase S8 n=1 Tax=Alteriqipengyuania lutimaris TaxID=1538146 RepID=A0A395LPT7_9SPHN|nr:peptidase S8 [Alteriqipengyuania lutimaris]
MTPWRQGVTGSGAAIAIIDTGIDIDSPEFAGRILPASRDVASDRGVDAVDDHGTNVALIAAAALDGTGVVGLAYDASLIVLRADQPGSCTPDETDADLAGCSFTDRAIARGIDDAVAADARVVNLSLGGSRPSQALLAAIDRATRAGVVVVVAAGNDGETDDPAIDPDNPDPFATGILGRGNGAVIIVGSVDDNGQISGFSNRAGNAASGYLTARGERLCCVYDNGTLQVTEENGSRFVTLFSGTSFATPQVAGAVALLAQAFPNLTGQDIVEILLQTARDAGEGGTDATYGRGILDLIEAFSPQGTTRMPGAQDAVSLANDIAIASAPMGNALQGASLPGILLDKYDRAYLYELGSRTRMASAEPLLHGAARTGLRRVAVGSPKVALAFTLQQRGQAGGDPAIAPLELTRAQGEAARVLAARVAMRIAPDTQLGFAFAEGPDGLAVQMQGRDRPAFLVSRGGADDLGFVHRDRQGVAMRRDLGPFGVTLTASRGEALTGALREASDFIGERREGYGFIRLGAVADRSLGPLDLTLGAQWLREERTVLGAYLHDSFGARGADSVFVNGTAAIDAGEGWRLGGEGRMGLTRAIAGGRIADGSRWRSLSFAFDASKRGVVEPDDRLGLRLSSPLRVTGGGLLIDMPVSYDYATRSAGFALRHLSLAPDGREVMGELAWSGRVSDGLLAASLFYRSEPGHQRLAPDDGGFILRWSRGF